MQAIYSLPALIDSEYTPNEVREGRKWRKREEYVRRRDEQSLKERGLRYGATSVCSGRVGETP